MKEAAQVATHLEQVYGLTGMKLQKVLYYAQAQALAQWGEPLFADDIQAWRYGPVVKAVYDGSRATPHLDGEEVALLAATAQTYGALEAWELSALTHADAPWQDTRAGLPESAGSDRVIPQATIKTFYLDHHLTRTAAGQWAHLPLPDPERDAARIRMLATRHARRGRRPIGQRAEFIRRQVIATQRLEGIEVAPGLLVHG